MDESELRARLASVSELQAQLLHQLSDGQQQMRGLAKRVWQVQEEERKKIALELHDGIGQLLTALINQLQQMNHENALDAPLSLARQALADTRALSRLLRPRILDDLGLEPALSNLVRLICENSALRITTHIALPGPLPAELQTLVFRLVQEGLNNAVKHAGPCEVALELRVIENQLKLRLRDDGKGFSPTQSQGFGLKGMQDRVAAFGGTWRLSSAIGKGCQIDISIPL